MLILSLLHMQTNLIQQRLKPYFSHFAGDICFVTGTPGARTQKFQWTLNLKNDTCHILNFIEIVCLIIFSRYTLMYF